MNVELLRKIAAVIQEKPAEFLMTDFHSETSCGTAHCIGGWAEELTGCSSLGRCEVLDITPNQANRLFFASEWPDQFQGTELFPEGDDNEDEDECWNPTPAQAAARIEHFIATEGRE